MKYLMDTRMIITVAAIVIFTISEIFKSIRINLFKEINKDKIEAIGNYEEKSKSHNLKILDIKESTKQDD